jgi:dTDP-4-dehydrorhamnose reductase
LDKADHTREHASVELGVDGASVLFGDGWGLIRASNTQPALVLRAEAKTPEAHIRVSPTYTVDAAYALECLVTLGPRGVVHATNEGSCTWYEVGSKVIELAGIDARVTPILASEYSTLARRRANPALQSDRLERIVGGIPRCWEQVLQACRKEKGNTKQQ